MTQNYETYEALDFAQDDSFIRWVKGEDDAARQFWEAWRSGHPEKAEEVEAARRLVLSLRVEEPEPDAARIDALWDRIDRATPAVKKPDARRIPLRRILQYAAAAVIGLAVFSILFNPAERIYSGDRQVVYQLPDGSSVNLNEGSAIAFKRRRWPRERTIQLTGEAFFSVRRGSPFTVVTPRGEVEVLGTSFNVRAAGQTFEVECLTGQVAVRHGDSRQVLSARQSTRLLTDGQLARPEAAERPDIAPWRNAEIVLNDARLADVLAELERQFGVTVINEVADDEYVIDAFFTNSNLDSALYNINYTIRTINLETRGDTVFVAEK